LNLDKKKLTRRVDFFYFKAMNKKATKEWAYPVTDWKILFHFKQNSREWCHEFFNVPCLKNYFTSVPEQAILVGYGKDLPQHRVRQNVLAVTDAKLSLWYVENGCEHLYQMENAKALAHFLDHHPTVAKAVSYRRRH
jgi:hypothetical protein